MRIYQSLIKAAVCAYINAIPIPNAFLKAIFNIIIHSSGEAPLRPSRNAKNGISNDASSRTVHVMQLTCSLRSGCRS
eukprot:scaffold460432_cov18-Prasinocladus_malaysianus.AAC.1